MAHSLLRWEAALQSKLLGSSGMVGICRLQPMGCRSCLMGWSFPVLIGKGSNGCLDRNRHLSRQETGLRWPFSQSQLWGTEISTQVLQVPGFGEVPGGR